MKKKKFMIVIVILLLIMSYTTTIFGEELESTADPNTNPAEVIQDSEVQIPEPSMALENQSITPAAVGETIANIFPDPNFAQVVADNVSGGDVNALLTQEMIDGFTFLVASDTQISDLTGIGHLTALDVIALDGSQITSIPSEIGNLTALTYLNLNFNYITSLPREIGNLTSLGVLALGENYLTSLPQEIENLPSLVSLEVSRNLLPTDVNTYLENLPSFSNVSISASQQSKLQLTHTDLEFGVMTQQDIYDIQSMGSAMTNVAGQSISANHPFVLDQYADENGPVDISEYIQNGRVIKSGTLYAKVRATGEGLFPNNSDNAITNDSVKLKLEAQLYTLSFDLNGGIGALPEPQSLVESALVKEPSNPTRDGYTFKGWNTVADGSGTTWDFTTTTMPANDVTLYAQWEKNTEPPVNPTNPNLPGNETPKTGDTSNILWLSVLMSLAGVTLVGMHRIKKIS